MAIFRSLQFLVVVLLGQNIAAAVHGQVWRARFGALANIPPVGQSTVALLTWPAVNRAQVDAPLGQFRRQKMGSVFVLWKPWEKFRDFPPYIVTVKHPETCPHFERQRSIVDHTRDALDDFLELVAFIHQRTPGAFVANQINGTSGIYVDKIHLKSTTVSNMLLCKFWSDLRRKIQQEIRHILSSCPGVHHIIECRRFSRWDDALGEHIRFCYPKWSNVSLHL